MVGFRVDGRSHMVYIHNLSLCRSVIMRVLAWKIVEDDSVGNIPWGIAGYKVQLQSCCSGRIPANFPAIIAHSQAFFITHRHNGRPKEICLSLR